MTPASGLHYWLWLENLKTRAEAGHWRSMGPTIGLPRWLCPQLAFPMLNSGGISPLFLPRDDIMLSRALAIVAGAMKLIDERTSDGSRHFARWSHAADWKSL